nr:ComEC/Rec2 family competence protein [uncultured Cohaesibacter sp.]
MENATQSGVDDTEIARSALKRQALEAPDWGPIAARPGLGRRFRFFIEDCWLTILENWNNDCSEQNARLLWVAVFLGAGAALYYTLPDEPSFWVLAIVSVSICSWSFLRARKGLVVFPLLLVSAVVVGLFVASETSKFNTTPVLAHAFSSTVIGRLVSVELRGTEQQRSERWTVAVESIGKMKPENTPKRLLLVRRAAGETFKVGERLKMRVHLTPLQQPAFPGGFNYGRYLWARAIGGQGYLGRSIERLPALNLVGLASFKRTLSEKIERTRQAVAKYIKHRIDGEAAGLIVALAVGKRDYLSDDVETALRHSGLAHILAISGLHMALVAMSVFWGVRGILALLPQLALRYSIKQWAAGAALFCAAAYLALSGASVATMRAFCMTAIFLVAILLKRPAVTMHNLALVFIFLIIIQPYGVIEAGMQMSFAATAALIASYDRLTGGRLRKMALDGHPGQNLPVAALITTTKWIFGIGLTSFIASLAVLPFSVFHFQQMAPYGLLTNLLAMPIISLVLMPMGLVSVFLTPFGLQSFPLMIVEAGADWVIFVAKMIADWSNADLLVVKAGGPFLPLAALALAIFTIHRGALSRLAIIPLAVAFFVWWAWPQPDLWVSQNGNSLAVRDDQGRWQRLGSSRMTMNFRALLRADGDASALANNGGEQIAGNKNRSSATGKSKDGCDAEACYMTGLRSSSGDETNLSLALIKKPSAFAEECAIRDIIVSRVPIPRTCIGPSLLMGEKQLEQSGARFVYFKKAEAKIDGDELEKLELARKSASASQRPSNATKRQPLQVEPEQSWRLQNRDAIAAGWRPWMPR